MATWLFVQHLTEVDNKQSIKTFNQWPFVSGIHWSIMDCPHKGPVMKEVFPYDDTTMPSMFLLVYIFPKDILWYMDNSGRCQQPFYKQLLGLIIDSASSCSILCPTCWNVYRERPVLTETKGRWWNPDIQRMQWMTMIMPFVNVACKRKGYRPIKMWDDDIGKYLGIRCFHFDPVDHILSLEYVIIKAKLIIFVHSLHPELSCYHQGKTYYLCAFPTSWVLSSAVSFVVLSQYI